MFKTWNGKMTKMALEVHVRLESLSDISVCNGQPM